jgi:hypothetical protein
MNGLKKLFSPSTLAATLASGMLLSSAIIALADDISTSTVTSLPGCGSGAPCSQFYQNCDTTLYWCCTSTHPQCDGTSANYCTNTVYGFCKSVR